MSRTRARFFGVFLTRTGSEHENILTRSLLSFASATLLALISKPRRDNKHFLHGSLVFNVKINLLQSSDWPRKYPSRTNRTVDMAAVCISPRISLANTDQNRQRNLHIAECRLNRHHSVHYFGSGATPVFPPLASLCWQIGIFVLLTLLSLAIFLEQGLFTQPPCCALIYHATTPRTAYLYSILWYPFLFFVCQSSSSRIGDNVSDHCMRMSTSLAEMIVTQKDISDDASPAASTRGAREQANAMPPAHDATANHSQKTGNANSQVVTRAMSHSGVHVGRVRNAPTADKDRTLRGSEQAPEHSSQHAKELEYDDLAKYFHLPITAGESTLVFACTNSSRILRSFVCVYVRAALVMSFLFFCSLLCSLVCGCPVCVVFITCSLTLISCPG